MPQSNERATAFANDIVYPVPEDFATDAARVQGIVDINIPFGKDIQTSQITPDSRKPFM
jgi:hypothetical protein